MMKFLQLDTLEELGLAHFDAWVQMFAETTQSLEMKPDGSGFRMNTRFNKFTNLPELAALWRQAQQPAGSLYLAHDRGAGVQQGAQVVELGRAIHEVHSGPLHAGQCRLVQARGDAASPKRWRDKTVSADGAEALAAGDLDLPWKQRGQPQGLAAW